MKTDQLSSIMVFGTGVIGARALFELAQSATPRHLHLFGRDPGRVLETANLAQFSALQRGLKPVITRHVGDVDDIDRTAETIASVAPDVTFLALSRQPYWVVGTLPSEAKRRLARAEFGPWLPMHVAPVANVMRAVVASDVNTMVVNAAYPDAVGPTLAGAGLAPSVGIGNVANNVPALRILIAEQYACLPYDVTVRVIAHHYVTSHMRHGNTAGGPVGFNVTVGGRDVSAETPIGPLLARIATDHRRPGGSAGTGAMTVASALSIIEPLADGTFARAHAPAPHGMVGGYPVVVNDGKIHLDLPDTLSVDEALRINSDGQRYDGIEEINGDGIVMFTDEASSIMRKELGYDCTKMHWTEAHDRSVELRARFLAYQQQALS